jgi:excisionase family DNA binding protein
LWRVLALCASAEAGEVSRVIYSKGAPLPNPANDNDRLFTPEQAALRLNITEDQLSALTQDGEIAYINVGRGKKRPRRRFTEPDLNDFVERRRKRETPCQSTKTRGRPITHSISSTPVSGFMARRSARLDTTRNDSKLQS